MSTPKEKILEAAGSIAAIFLATDCTDADAAFRQLAHAPAHNAGMVPSILSVPILQGGKFLIGFTLASMIAEADEPLLRAPRDHGRTTVVLGNAAPRAVGTREARGCGFVAAALPNNILYVGTIGPELAWVRGHLQEGTVLDVDIPINGTQFRSRYLISLLGRLMRGDANALQGEHSLENVPHPASLSPDGKSVVPVIDRFGNIKLDLTEGEGWARDLTPGDSLELELNGQARELLFAEGIGQRGNAGDLILTPGSSYHRPGERFLEVQQNAVHGRTCAAWQFRATDLDFPPELQMPQPGQLVVRVN